MHWAQMQEAGSLAGMRFMLHVYRLCGRWPFRFLLFFVLLWFYMRRRTAREASHDYLQRLHAFSGSVTPKPARRNVFRHFLAFSEILLDKLLGVSDSSTNYRVDGGEYIDTLHKQKRGAILVTAHIGNNELCRRLAGYHANLHMTVLMHTKNSVRFTQVMKEFDPSYGVDVIQTRDIGIDTAIVLAQRIAAGHFIVIAGDRVPVGSATATVRVPFLGSEASFPISPYVLAATLQCPLFAVFGVRRREGFVVTLRQIAESVCLPRRDRETAVILYARAFAERLGEECLGAPFQWSNFYPFWALPTPGENEEAH
jgi:predicted LPLAT superfamily acyltransferase